MAWQHSLMATGLGGDKDLEAQGILSSDITLSGGKIVFPTDTDNKKALTKLPGTANWGSGIMFAFSFWFTTPAAAPSSEIGIVTDGTQGPTKRWFRIGTDMKLKFYDQTGTLITSGLTALATSTEYECVVVFDGLTLATVWVSLTLGPASGTLAEDAAKDTGIAPGTFAATTDLQYLGEWIAAAGGSNHGKTFSARYGIARSSPIAGDAPHLTAYPRLLGYGAGVVTVSGDLTEYPNGTTPGANSYQDVDEAGAGDGNKWADLGNLTVIHTQLAAHGTANTLSSSAVIANAQIRMTAKLDAAGKVQGTGTLRLAGTTYVGGASQGNGLDTTVYSGRGTRFVTNPATSAAWIYTDWDLSAGVSKWQFGVQVIASGSVKTGDYVDVIRGLEAIYSTANMPLTMTPTTGGSLGGATGNRRRGAIV